MIYSDNEEVQIFYNKVQNKIAELGYLIADEQEDEWNFRLLLDLCDILESFDSPYNTWTLVDTLRIIHLWNKRADLNNTPYLQISGYTTYINVGNGQVDLTYLEATVQSLALQILNNSQHNNLQGIQGGTGLERYHLTQAQLDWLDCQMAKTPCPSFIAPTVGLSRSSNGSLSPFGFYELGSEITATTLQGSMVLNSGGVINYMTYYKNGVEYSGARVTPGSTTVAPLIDNSSITTDTTYRFDAEFATGGLKSASLGIQFKPPILYGLIEAGSYNDIAEIMQGTKIVRNPGSMTLTFNIPAGNTAITDGTHLIPYLFIPTSWPQLTSAMQGTFDFKNDFALFGKYIELLDGSTIPGYYYAFQNQIEGPNTFTFNF